MTSIILEALLWGAKLIFSARDKKKLSDKEFVEYVLAHQKKKSLAGKSALSWEQALADAKAELKAEEDTQA